MDNNNKKVLDILYSQIIDELLMQAFEAGRMCPTENNIEEYLLPFENKEEIENWILGEEDVLEEQLNQARKWIEKESTLSYEDAHYELCYSMYDVRDKQQQLIYKILETLNKNT